MNMDVKLSDIRLLQRLPYRLLDLVEDQLTNNEAASDEELMLYFIESGLSWKQACIAA